MTQINDPRLSIWDRKLNADKWKVTDSDGQVLEKFRTKTAAKHFIMDYKKNCFADLRIERLENDVLQKGCETFK